MGSIFINKDETIKVNIWVGEDDNSVTRYWNKKEDMPENVESAEKYSVEFRKPNFRDSTVLLDLGVRMNSQGGMDLAFSEIRFRRLEMLLKSWNLKDENGKNVPATPDQISNLHPTFAMVLAAGLERALGIEDGLIDQDSMTDENDQTETDQKVFQEENLSENEPKETIS